MKMREDEEEMVLNWLNMQTVYSDSIRFLIQKEIAENGLRNLQHFIPQFRTVDTLKAQILSATNEVPVQSILTSVATDTVNPTSGAGSTLPSYTERIQEDQARPIPENPKTDALKEINDEKPPVLTHTESTGMRSANPSTESEPIVEKRKAKKTFGDDVTSSYAN